MGKNRCLIGKNLLHKCQDAGNRGTLGILHYLKALLETGQVCIQIRDVGGIVGQDAGQNRTTTKQDDNPFDLDTVKKNIIDALGAEGFIYDEDYIIMQVPNIVDISYGRGVGYTFTQHDLGEDIHNISATKIRAQLRAEGKL